MRAILERKYGDLCPPSYVEMVVGSFQDDPVLLREPKYTRGEVSLPMPSPIPLDKRIVLVVNEKNLEWSRQLVADEGFAKVSDVCPGGERRQDSVAAGLNKLDNCEWVLIHDGARPLVTVDLIERGLEAAQRTGAAIAAVPVTDTIKAAGDDRIVRQTLPRQNLWAVQTPQVFSIEIIKKAYQRANDDVTDDASLVEQSGGKVALYMGSYDNIKVTTHDDLILAEALLCKNDR